MRISASLPILVLVASCSPAGQHGATGDDSRTSQAPLDTIESMAKWAAGSPIRLYSGDGYTLRIPVGATVRPDSGHFRGGPGVAIVGPAFSMTGQWPNSVQPVSRRGAAYELVVAVLPNPSREALARFVDSIVAKDNAAMAPEYVDGKENAKATRIADQPAFVITEPCGDCWGYSVFLAHDTRIAVLSYGTDDNDLLDALSAPLYWLMIDSFRWGAPGSPSAGRLPPN